MATSKWQDAGSESDDPTTMLIKCFTLIGIELFGPKFVHALPSVPVQCDSAVAAEEHILAPLDQVGQGFYWFRQALSVALTEAVTSLPANVSPLHYAQQLLFLTHLTSAYSELLWAVIRMRSTATWGSPSLGIRYGQGGPTDVVIVSVPEER
jgi:hypothetical protein